MTKGEYGRWEVTLPAKDGQLTIPHGSKVKVTPRIRGRCATTNTEICVDISSHTNFT